MKPSRLPYFINGWLLYISAIKLLWNELHASFGFKFLRTRKLPQDCLEHFFATIRWKNGNNYHPDSSLFSSAYKALVINHLVIPAKVGNVQPDLSKYIVNRFEMSKVQMVQKEHKRPDYLGKVSEDPTTLEKPDDVNKLANIHWTTGWAVSKIRHTECLRRATAEAEDVDVEISFLSDLKKFCPTSKTVSPGEKIFRYFSTVCQLFKTHFNNILKLDTVGVKEELMDIIQLQFNFPGIDEDNAINMDGNVEDRLILDVLCRNCALIITNKYLNMLIACKLGEINSLFKAASTSKKKSKKADKSKKLNIANFSKLLTPKAAETESQKKKPSTSQVFDTCIPYTFHIYMFTYFRNRHQRLKLDHEEDQGRRLKFQYKLSQQKKYVCPCFS